MRSGKVTEEDSAVIEIQLFHSDFHYEIRVIKMQKGKANKNRPKEKINNQGIKSSEEII